jgi:hypothetical protein
MKNRFENQAKVVANLLAHKLHESNHTKSYMSLDEVISIEK